MSWHRERCSGLWRSEDMVRVHIILQREVLHDSMLEVGMMGKVQFIDLNEGVTAFARPFTEELRRCEELQRKMHFIEESFHKDPHLLDSYDGDRNMCASVEEVRNFITQGQLNVIEDRIESAVSELSALESSIDGFRHEMNHVRELRILHIMYQKLLGNTTENGDEGNERMLFSPEALSRLAIFFGIIDVEHSEQLRRLCFRISRGNVIVEISNATYNFVNTKTGCDTVMRVSFVVLSSSALIIGRLRKLVAAMGASVYSSDEFVANDMGQTMMPHGHHTEVTLTTVEERRRRLLKQWYVEHRLYKTFLRLEKIVLTTMNSCALSGSTCTASAWVPERYEQALREALQIAVTSSNGSVESIVTRHEVQKSPPTYFETNWFTVSFQSIVDSYGVARYKEVNPGVFTIITFPYLFGIMYGDIGHGFLLLFIALFFVSKQNQWQSHQLNEMVAMLFGGRYLLLLMSLFAIYMGLLYNDFFGFSLNLFSSGYTWADIDTQNGTTVPVEPNGKPSVKPTHVYSFGLDAAWAETENKLEFYNSVKMKHAVVVGVIQMFAGLFLSLNNSLYEKNWYRVTLLFIPEFVFLISTFGYMAVLIIVKWCHVWSNTNDAPSLLETMTNFFLQPTAVSKPLFAGQMGLQIFLLIAAFSMVPIMLVGMPYVEYKEYQEWRRRRSVGTDHSGQTMVVIEGDNPPLFPPNNPSSAVLGRGSDNFHDGGSDIFFGNRDLDPFGDAAAGDGMIHPAEDEDNDRFLHFDFSEVVIHYIIHTIEYVLSSVSNTASYLRLWALSLAHAQLSEVFFSFTVVKALSVSDSSGIVMCVAVMLWLAATMGVLVGMEALSAFLHALRLHWVEFQNKFYSGDGRAFEPMDLLALNS